MSKQQTRRKITVKSPLKRASNAVNDSHRRPSVFERLGNKAVTSTSNTTVAKHSEISCRQWNQNGTCQYGKNCKYSDAHALISPSKRAALKDAESKGNNKQDRDIGILQSVADIAMHKVDLSKGLDSSWQHASSSEPSDWDLIELDYQDEQMLEKRRQLLKRELEGELMHKDSGTSSVSGSRGMRKNPKSNKGASSSSSSGSSSTDSESSSSSGDSSTSSSSESTKLRRHKAKRSKSNKAKRRSSSVSDVESSKKKSSSRRWNPNEVRPIIVRIRTNKGSPSPSKKGSRVNSSVRDMKHTRKGRSRDRAEGHTPPPRKTSSAASKKSTTPPLRGVSHKRRSLSPPSFSKGSKSSQTGSKTIRNNSSLRSPARDHKDRERDRDKDRDVHDKDRDNKKLRDREKEREREKEKDRERDRDREKDRNDSKSPKGKIKDRMSRSPRRDAKSAKEGKRRNSPDGLYLKTNRSSSGSANQKGRDSSSDCNKRKVSPGGRDIWHRKDDEDRKRDDRRGREHDEKERDRDRDRDRDKDSGRDRDRDRGHDRDRDRDKDKTKSMLQGIPSLLTLNLPHNPSDYNCQHRPSPRPSDRGNKVPRNRSLDRGRGSDRDRDRRTGFNNGGLEKGLDHSGLEKELAKALNRNREQDRTFDRNDRVENRALKNVDRDIDRGSPRLLDRDSDRGGVRPDRAPDRGLDRGGDRLLDRDRDRASPRDRDRAFDRFGDRSPGLFDRAITHIDRGRDSAEKGYDSPYEGRRGNLKDRGGRFAEQARYDKVPDDRRLGSNESVCYGEERRRGRDGGRSAQEAPRGNQWEGRGLERSRDQHLEREHDNRERGGRGYDPGQRPSAQGNGAPGKRNDWDWEGRGRRPAMKDWEGTHRPEGQNIEKDWGRFGSGPSEWSGSQNADRRAGSGYEDWRAPPAPASGQHGPPPHGTSSPASTTPSGRQARLLPPNREEPAANSYIAGHKPDEPEEGSRHKDQVLNESKGDGKKTEAATEVDAGLTISHKRARDGTEDDDLPTPEVKRALLEDKAALEEVLSDISDDADEILNREDIMEEDGAVSSEVEAGEVTSETAELSQGATAFSVRGSDADDVSSVQTLSSTVQFSNATPNNVHQKTPTDGPDDDGVENLDFEEISDEELEEEARTNKGIGDALGVDWASLVAETRPHIKNDACGTARQRWEGVCVLARMGISVQYAGEEMVHKILEAAAQVQANLSLQKSKDINENGGDAKEGFFPESKDECKNSIEKPDTPILSNGDNDEGAEEKQLREILHPVAGIHSALLEKRARRKMLLSSTGPYKQALSARRDLAERRQLCSLSSRETTFDSGPTMDELFRHSVQLLERTL